ncbi:hypothetical protein SMACR_09056 [Sordaria macrospora]|uniref:WGS project CABT00000000 data, contig 2.8 n=2 Tax=Sordaria macrospora TaxID=5147 RepID=F7VUT8_SORMK|nr:uncharacterized protein SMAC_09056 [Sordaria macrospora k-hell]KAA8636248.1 hypothetical protein SMACR_09056 [Sordaria macrospora]CCC09284.1 unnamed protein product [Sordaria macrospora k-hell]
MASQLPSFPRFVFTKFEPISLLSGFLPAILNPDWFTHQQLLSHPPSSSQSTAYPPASRTTTRQLGNMYFLAFLVGIGVLYSPCELKVVRNYLIALWVADLGHMLITAEALGWEGTVDMFLFLTRTAYLMGLFGPDRPRTVVMGAKKTE